MAAYPRVQTVVTFVVCTMVVTGVAAYVYGGTLISSFNKKTPEVAQVSGSPSDTNTLIETADWKETFFNVTETGDNKYETSSAKKVSSANTDEKLTATDLFGREFFSKFMALRQAGMISDPNVTEAMVQQVAEDSWLIADGPKIYSTKDIVISTTEDTATREAYANAVARTLTRNQPIENEALIAKKALETGDTDRLADIEPIISIYATVRSELLRIPTPPSAAKYHTSLINGISEALANAVALRNSAADPLQGLSAASNYPVTVSNVFYTVLDLRSYFDEYGIVFGPDDDAFTVFSMK